jgi:hypothetical protein
MARSLCCRARCLTSTSLTSIFDAKGFGDKFIEAFFMKFPRRSLSSVLLALTLLTISSAGQSNGDDRAAEIVNRAVQALGGDRYLQVRTQVGKGKFSLLRDGGLISFQSFLDVIAFPDRERTEFKGGGSRTVQVNTGDTGWIYDGDQDLIKVQTDAQVASFRQGIRTSLENILRGYWKSSAELSYVGRRPSTLGKRNEVVRLTYKDGFIVEFEFAVDDGLPQKALYTRSSPGGDVKEEDRYAQFLDVNGIKAAFVIDRFTEGKQASRINYESIEFNKAISDTMFAKPATVKEAKRNLKY